MLLVGPGPNSDRSQVNECPPLTARCCLVVGGLQVADVVMGLRRSFLEVRQTSPSSFHHHGPIMCSQHLWVTRSSPLLLPRGVLTWHSLTHRDDTCRQARGLLRSMGEAAGVEVEPPAQTQLADTTMQVGREAPGTSGDMHEKLR